MLLYFGSPAALYFDKSDSTFVLCAALRAQATVCASTSFTSWLLTLEAQNRSNIRLVLTLSTASVKFIIVEFSHRLLLPPPVFYMIPAIVSMTVLRQIRELAAPAVH